MVKNGLINEIKDLLNKGVNRDHQCMQAIGYKEFLDYFDGVCTLEKAIENVKINTRHYAKRQITFFKRLPNLTQLQFDQTDKLVDRILEDIKND